MIGEFYAVLALLLFAANVFIVRPASARVGLHVGFLVVLISNTGFAVLLLLGQELTRDEPLRADLFALGLFALAGVFANYLGRWGYFRTIHTLGPSRASAVQNSSPLFAVLLAWLLLGQALGGHQLVLMGVVVWGLYLTSSAGRAGRLVTARGGNPKGEVVVALAAAGAYAMGNVIRGGAVGRWQEPVLGAFVGAVAAAATYVAVHVRLRRLPTLLHGLPRGGLLLWTLSGSIMICAQAAMIAATAYLPVGVVVAVSAATPAIVIPASVLLFGNAEQVTLRVASGAALITCGVAGLLLL